MTTYSISAGQTSNGVTLNSGDTEYIYSGGTVIGTTVINGGTDYVSGVESGTTTVNSGGLDIVYKGGQESNATVNSGGNLWLGDLWYNPVPGGAASGGISISATINSGGNEWVVSGGVTSNATVNNGGIVNIQSGGVAIGTVINSGGVEYIQSGCSVSGGSVNSGGTISGLVMNSGAAVITNGAYSIAVDGINIHSGALVQSLEVASGASVTGFIANQSAVLTIDSGGTAGSTTLNSGSIENISGTVSGAILNGGTFNLHGVANGVIVINGGIDYVSGVENGTTTVNSGGLDIVYKGGQESNATVNSGGNLWLGDLWYNPVPGGAASGGISISATINSGGNEWVVSGGVTSNATVNNGGIVNIQSGGVAIGTVINSGGVEYIQSGCSVSGGSINSGGTISGLVMNSGAAVITNGAYSIAVDGINIHSGALVQSLEVASGASVTGFIVNQSAVLTIDSGGTAGSTTLNSGGIENISGTVSGAIINGGTFNLHGVANGAIVINGGVDYVLGMENGTTTINSGGLDIVYSGAQESNATVNSGGNLWLGDLWYNPVPGGAVSGGISISATINSGGNEWVVSGGVASNTTINNGGTVYLQSGGAANGTIINSGGVEDIQSGCSVSGGSVNSGGTISGLVMNSGAAVITNGAYSIAVDGISIQSGAVVQSLEVASGASVTGFIANQSAVLTIDSGGTAGSTTLNSGGIENISGTVSGAIINGGTFNLHGVANGAIVINGGVDYVLGMENGTTTINSGGLDIVYSGAQESNATVNSGGNLWLGDFWYNPVPGGAVSGGISISATINSGGNEWVVSGGVTSNTTINNGGIVYLQSGGVASGTIINSGGVEDIQRGCSVSGGSINSGGMISGLIMYSGATVVSNGAYSNPVDGISIYSGAVVETLEVASGASVTGFVANQGILLTVDSGGAVSSTTVNSGGIENISGTVNGAILNGGVFNLYGLASGVTINSGGLDIVNSGAQETNTAVNNGGNLWLGDLWYNPLPGGAVSGGIAVGVTINSGGNEWVVSGGVASNTTINSGGNQWVESGGITSNATVNSGGTENIQSGGVASGTIINGGTVVFAETVAANQSVIFAHGGELLLDNAAGFAGIISAFSNGDSIDLAKIGTVSGVSWSNGTLAVAVTGGSTIDLALAGNYQGATFNFAGDNNGGDTITVSGIFPTVASAAYNEASGLLSLTGGNLTKTAGGYTVTDFTLTGDGGASYTLTSGSVVSGTPTSSSVSIHLSTADQLAIDGLLNKNGAQANDGVTTYNLAASSGWDTGANGISIQGITVTSVSAPKISTVAYNATTGVFTVTGGNLDNHGSSNGIALADFKLNGGGSSYSFSAGNDVVSNLTATGFTVTLSSADQASVNAFVNANGSAPLSGAAYQLTAGANWDSDSGAAITTQAVNVTGVPQPVLSTVSYNAASGQLSLIGSNLTSSAGAYLVTDFSLKGDGGVSYTLTSGSTVTGTPTATGVTIQLSAADQLAIDGLLNKAGTQANDGVTNYNLSAAIGWDTGASAISKQAVTVTGFTAPTISNVAYNFAGGVFTVTGANLDNHGSSLGLALGDFKLSGGGGSYSFNATNDIVSNLTATGFTVTLSAADKAAVNIITNANGAAPLSGAAYNVTAGANWDSDSGAAISTQALTVSGVPPYSQSLFATTAYPANIVADAAGDLFVNGLNGISEIAAGSKAVTNLTAAANLGVNFLSVPVTVDSSGNVYAGVSEMISNGSLVNYGIVEIAAGSHALSLLPAQTANVLGLTVDSAGDLFAAEGNNTVYELAAGSRAVSVIASAANGLLGANGLAVDNHANLYIGEANGNIVETAIGSHTLSTVLSGTPQSGGLFYAGGSLGIDGTGNVYFLSGSSAGGWAVGEIAAGSHTVSTVAAFSPVNSEFIAKGVTVDGAGNIYITDFLNSNIQELAVGTSAASLVKTQADSVYLLNSQPLGSPLSINNLQEGTAQIELSKAVYTAFAGDSAVTAANFSNASAATGVTDYLYYNAANGGLYYDAHGASTPGATVEIAVVGVGSHPADLSLADFKLLA